MSIKSLAKNVLSRIEADKIGGTESPEREASCPTRPKGKTSGTVAGTVKAVFERKTAAVWTRDDWQTFYDERAGIAEYEQGLSREGAEAVALECCVVEWLNQNPEPSEPGRCAHCGKAENDGPVILPFGTREHGHTWLHAECWKVWHSKRKQKAREFFKSVAVFQTSIPTEKESTND